MNVSIIVFSPSGHTLKTAKMIEKVFTEKNNNVRLINITGKIDFLYGNRIKENLEKDLGEYDVLFIGGPLYAGHVEHHILEIIEALPFPDEKHSNLAVPFVTYGGVHSSIALEEMARHLKKKKYKSILGLKIAAKHTLTTTLSNIIYANKPGPEEEKLIEKAVERVISIIQQGRSKAVDQYQVFKYAPTKERIMFRQFSQEMIHKKFKKVTINTEKCIKCKKCISVCPVDMFQFIDGEISMHRDNNNCILCAECFHNCPVGAIEHPYIEMAGKRLKDGFAALEKVPSAIYPTA
ncbi:MAG: EFR1 family ferrodoxin [Spirochaetales bacterium]|nr:EFR1 family ferrodoxin [Spirochaetales bacterium]